MSTVFLDSGIELILTIQGFGSWLLTPMQFFSFLGNEFFFLLIAPIIFWCLDAALGLRLGLFLMTSASLNSILKLLFHTPRPYWYSREVVPHGHDPYFSAPSGHAQHSVVFWGALASFFRTRSAWIIAVGLMLFIGISRIYLAVHYPVDVVIGWVVGVLLLWLLLLLERALLPWLKGFNLVSQIALAFVASLGLIFLAYLARLSLGAWEIPTEWIQNALYAFPDEPITPLELSGVVSSAATFFGLAAGGILLYRLGWYDASGPAGKLALRYLLGLIGMVVIFFGLGSVFPRGDALVPLVFRFVRYSFAGLWVTLLAPLLFLTLGLASRPEQK